jgi:DNA modification methylase
LIRQICVGSLNFIFHFHGESEKNPHHLVNRCRGGGRSGEMVFGGLYDKSLTSTRGDPIFNIHSYATKIDPVAVLACILAHTEPGEVVFDGFSGSGTTAIASLLAQAPGDSRLSKIKEQISSFKLGARACHAFDVSGLAWYIGNTLVSLPPVETFREAAEHVIAKFKQQTQGVYRTTNESKEATIRHVVWSEVIKCTSCDSEIILGDIMVDLELIKMNEVGSCPHCKAEVRLSIAPRVMESKIDPIIHEEVQKRKLVPWMTYGKTGKKNWRRKSIVDDIGCGRYDFSDLNVPIRKMMDSEEENWGELHRSGYHKGMSYVHQFYTTRNLWVIAKIKRLIEAEEPDVQPALMLWLSSYISTHATLMTRVVCKRGSKDLTTTSKETATMYVSNLPVEKNVISGLEYKLKSFCKGFSEIPKNESTVTVHHRTCTDTGLDDHSIDYVFIDPPFGDNIQYSEVNFINEAWLGLSTDVKNEAIVSQHQQKTDHDYSRLLYEAFREIDRILKPSKFITIAFHSAKAKDWHSISSAWDKAGFAVVNASVLNKEQGSLKQVTTYTAVKGDSLILLTRKSDFEQESSEPVSDVWRYVRNKITSSKEEIDRQSAYSMFVNYCLLHGIDQPSDSSEFFDWYASTMQEINIGGIEDLSD